MNALVVRGLRGSSLAVAGLSAMLLGLSACSATDASPGSAAAVTGSAGPTGSAAAGALGGASGWADLVARTEPSVVTIVTQKGLGSGVVYRADGVIVTNAHVVENASKVTVAFADGSRASGDVTAKDVVTDVATVKVARAGLPAARWRDSLPRPGEVVLAMGSPLGLENSVTQGIVSGVGRQLPGSAASGRALVDLIQTDAAISPGNSGGALVDTGGALVGLNEAYLPPQSGAVAIGFAIPAATVRDVADQLLATGRAVHPFVGVSVAQLTPQIAQALGVSISTGVLVQDVSAGGPADTAGIKEGDVMTALAGSATPTVEDFLAALRRHEPGDRVPIQLHRGGREQTVQVTLGTLGQ